MTPKVRQTLEGWSSRARREADAHRRACRRLERLNYQIGIPTVIISSIVATAVFASLNESVSLLVKLVVGFISVTAAILSGVQTFVRPSVRAEQHRAAQIGLERIVRDIETLLVLEDSAEPADLSGSVDALSERLAEAQKLAPMPAVRDYAPSSLMFDLRQVDAAPEAAATEPRAEASGSG